MKKFYAFLAAALMSVSLFASESVVPSDEVLAEYYEAGNVCVCIFVPSDMACGDFVLTGSFNGWASKAADCVPFEAVIGYDGWYVSSFEPEAEPDATKGIQAKPVMLDIDGNFNWDYQVGAATKVRGGVEVVKGSYEGEIDLINYGKDKPNVFKVDAWKKNPCTAIYHNYSITVISDGCNGFAVPFLVGAMTNWEFKQMPMNIDKTVELGIGVYTINFKAAEESPYQITSGLMDAEGAIAQQPGWKDEAYLQVLLNDKWVRMPGESGDNRLTHEEADILFDLRVDTLRWARCDGEVAENVVVKLKAPQGAPEEVEIIGSFGEGWDKGTAMTLNEGVWEATVAAKPSNVFKFRQAGTWDNQIEFYDAENDKWCTFGDDGAKSLQFSECWSGEEGARVVELDFSDAENYRWKKDAGEIPSAVIVYLKAPADAPEAVEVIGSFDSWTGTAMMEENGIWAAIIEATGDDTFKFRTGVGEDSDAKWQNQIQVFKDGAWKDMDNLVFKEHWAQGEGDFAEYKIVELDFSDGAAYKWTLSEAQGIESVVLTEKANKVVVNGVIYIVRDNKVFNLQGAQVR